MEGGLDRDTARCAEIDLDGAENTARLLTERGRS
jgi:hypothetical protein